MDIYCIDTSSLIEMKDKYPKDIFPSVWQKIERLCKESRLIAPIEVLKEIEQVDDELKRWAKKKEIKKTFIKPDKYQTERMKEILVKYPFLAGPEKLGSNADPWLIALTIEKNYKEQTELFQNRYIVVTEESKVRKERIPIACKDYNIECINLLELFKKEKWKF